MSDDGRCRDESGVAADARTPKDSGTHGKAKPRMEQRSQAEATRAKAIEKASANERTRLDKPTAHERTEAGVRVPDGVKLAAAAVDPGPRTAAAWGDGSMNQLGTGYRHISRSIAQAVPIPDDVVQHHERPVRHRRQLPGQPRARFGLLRLLLHAGAEHDGARRHRDCGVRAYQLRAQEQRHGAGVRQQMSRASSARATWAAATTPSSSRA